MRALSLKLLLLTACVRPTVAQSPPQPPVAGPQQRPPRIGCDAPGPKFSVIEQHIIFHDTGDPMPSFSTEPGRLLRLDGDALYFFDLTKPVLLTVGAPLETLGEHDARTVLELPPLAHPGFSSSDPLGYLWRQEDLSITDHILCMDLHDRPDDPNVTYNLRVDLTTTNLARHLVHDRGHASRGAGSEVVRPRLCTPAGPSAAASHDGNCVYVGWHSVIPLPHQAATKTVEN